MSKDAFCGLLLIIGIIVTVLLELYRIRKPQGILKEPMYRDKYEYLAYLENEMHYWQGEYNYAFDDIITRGDSMKIMSSKLNSLGAHVIGGISIGKTKHLE